MRTSAAATGLLVAAGLVLPGLALAQTTPTPNQIVKALTPAPGMGHTTRGIRVVQGAAPATVPSVSLSVDFATGSAELTLSAKRTLDSLGKALNDAKLTHDRFRIEGHTDTVGSARFNQTLSAARANRVAQYLEDTFGIARSRLHPVGMGEHGLLVPTPPQTPEARNRRVLIVNEGG